MPDIGALSHAVTGAPRAGGEPSPHRPLTPSELGRYLSVARITPKRKATAETRDVATIQPTIEGDLFANRAALKIATSQVAMHLQPEERIALFGELDRLLDFTHWEDESSKIDVEAFRTFLRFLIFARPKDLPNIGVAPEGHVLASWHLADTSIFVEFLPEDQCSLIVRSRSDRGDETLAWRGHVAALRDVITRNRSAEALDQDR
jgi:hypothetical protein